MTALLVSFRPRCLLVMIPVALIFLGTALLGGCSANFEDQHFYERGWLWPRDLDRTDRPVTPREKADAAADDEPFDE